MRDSQWIIKLIVSVVLAQMLTIFSIKASGYVAEGVFDLTLNILLAITVFSYFAIVTRIVSPGPDEYIAFDATAKNSLSDFLIFRTNGSVDNANNIKFYSLSNKKIFLNPFVSLVSFYIFAVCTLHLAMNSAQVNIMDYVFLLTQSFIIFAAALILFMAVFQLPSIIKFLKIKAGLVPAEEGLMRLIPSFLKSKAVGTTLIKKPKKPKAPEKADLDEKFAPALDVLSAPVGNRFKSLYASVVDLSYEIENISNDFNVPSSNFDEELAVINEIVNVFYPTTLANCEKTFSNTTLTKDLRMAFQEKVERSIVYKIRSYEDAIKRFNMNLLEMRLAPFDTSGIDPYVKEAHLLHHKITLNSGAIANKHLIISQSVMKDLLPSLIKTWSMATTPEQKASIEQQFEQIINFLKSQLSALETNKKSVQSVAAEQKMLSLDIGNEVSLNELNSKIGQNGQYIKMLQDQWV